MVDFLRFKIERQPLLQLPDPISGTKRDIIGGKPAGRRIVVDIDDIGGTAVIEGCKARATGVEPEGPEEERGEEEATGYDVERHDWLAMGNDNGVTP